MQLSKHGMVGSLAQATLDGNKQKEGRVKYHVSKNAPLNRASVAKEDEFYTQLSDIENELKYYHEHFKGKIVLCNCDDPRISNFFHYFSYNFEKLGLKKLITTCYKSRQLDMFSQNNSERAIYLEYDGDKNEDRIPNRDEITKHNMKKDGDFRNDECIEILKRSDIVVTNPPFSLFREYIAQLIKYNKHFLIIGNQNAAIYKEIFPLIRDNKIWHGYHAGDMKFKVPNYYKPRNTRYWQDEDGQKWRSFGTMCWFTNLDIKKRHENLILHKTHSPQEYPSYDNYDAIDVGKVADIPVDYDGVMGVPLTFLNKHNPDQFEILGSDYNVKQGLLPELLKTDWDGKIDRGYITGNRLYSRIFIKHKRKSCK